MSSLRTYFLYSSPGSCETYILHSTNYYDIISGVLEKIFPHEKNNAIKLCERTLEDIKQYQFPANLERFGEMKPNYDNSNNICDPEMIHFGFSIDNELEFMIYVVDLSNPFKYYVKKPIECLCFDKPFHFGRKKK